ncbi:MAG: DUF6261 family protein [Prevotellaceae bacterium]|jgi:hypothetical protein|nr:DUF6261 family protein [Prevotellaceae bacterium]
MKILRLDFRRLRNEEWFQLFTEFRDLVLKYNADELNIAELWATFLLLYADADTALEIIRKSADTALMIEADHVRDHTFRGFVDAVKSARNHFDPAKRAAAEKLIIIFDHFGNLAHKAFNEETAGIHNLLEEFDRGAPETELPVDVLGLRDWANKLAADNDAYEALVKDRNTEVASRSKLRMKEVRSDLQEVYYKMVARIEATMTLNGEVQPFTDFVNEWNAFLKHYSDVLAQRTGRRHPVTPDTDEIEN